MKNKLFLFLILQIPFFIFSQKSKTNDIDLYLAEAKKYSESFENIKSLESGKKANILALQKGNAEQIARSYYGMSLALYNLRMTKESLNAAEKGLQKKFVNDKILKAKLHNLKAVNYGLLHLYHQSRAECDKVIEILAGQEANTEAAVIISDAYQNIINAHYSESKNSLDSIKKYSKKSFAILRGKPVEQTLSALKSAYISEGFNHLDSKNMDSAKYYFNQVSQLNKQYDVKYSYDINDAWGQYYFDKKEYSTALNYYLNVVTETQHLGFKNRAIIDFESIYLDISKTYAQLGNTEKEKEYLNIYIIESKKVGLVQKQAIAEAMKIIHEEDVRKNNYEKYIIIAVAGLIIALLLGYYFLNKRKNSKLLLEKEEELLKNEEENQELKQKVNESFEEVVELAKENSPEFLTRFQEIYPEFTHKLKEIYPEISSDDIRFCALLKLNFSTKDIAEYTFVTVRSVQTRKSRLRKKFNITSDEDIYLWMNELG